jgi:hypothetical protein
MGHSYEYEHLGADIPDTKVVTPRVIRMSGDIEVRPFPPFPYDWEMAATAGDSLMEDYLDELGYPKVKPTLRQRIRSAFRWTW